MANLGKKRLDNMKKRLEDRHEELREEIHKELLRSDQEHNIDLAGDVRDSGEESVAEMLADLNITMIDRQVNELRQIEAALGRITTGAYGVCVDCQNDIDIARLEYTPYVERCTACQSRYEKIHSRENTPAH